MLQTNPSHYPVSLDAERLSSRCPCPCPSSPGPDAYESNYNIYEDLDGDSERSILSQNESVWDFHPVNSSAETTLVTNNEILTIPNYGLFDHNTTRDGQNNHQTSNANFYAPSFMMMSGRSNQNLQTPQSVPFQQKHFHSEDFRAFNSSIQNTQYDLTNRQINNVPNNMNFIQKTNFLNFFHKSKN